MSSKVEIKEVWEARKRIASLVKKTPLVESLVLSQRLERQIYLKLENTHEMGSFKIRGAANKILSLSKEEKRRGVTTYSTGNHGMAVAFVAKKLGIEAVVCISNRVPKVKVDLLKSLGAQIEIVGGSQDETSLRCYELQGEQGYTVIEPFDDQHVIAGQGTIGLELLEDVPNLGHIVVPLSGGGLLSGIGLALKTNSPEIRITGVSMEKSAVMHESIKAGKPLEMDESKTLADSLLGGIGLNNQYTFNMVKEFMDQSVLIPEDEIGHAIAYMMDKQSIIVEGAAAAGIAAVLGNQIIHQNQPLAVIVSGRNVDTSVLLEMIQKYT